MIKGPCEQLYAKKFEDLQMDKFLEMQNLLKLTHMHARAHTHAHIHKTNS